MSVAVSERVLIARSRKNRMVVTKGKRAPVTPPKRKSKIYTEVSDITEIPFLPLDDMVIDVYSRMEVTLDLKLADF